MKDAKLGGYQSKPCALGFHFRAGLLWLLSTILGTVASGCGGRDVKQSGLVPFAEIFSPVDTVFLDRELLIGSIRQIDVSPGGAILAEDIVTRVVHLLRSDGTLVRTLDPRECSPDAQALWGAKFVFSDGILAPTSEAAYFFDPTGDCVKRVTSLADMGVDFCTAADTLFVFKLSRIPRIQAWSREFVQLYDKTLRPLRSPALGVMHGSYGRLLSCSDDDVRYLYADQSDAVSIYGDELPRYAPAAYQVPPRIRRSAPGVESISAAVSELTTSYYTGLGTFAIGKSARIVSFALPSKSSVQSYALLNVVDEEIGTSLAAYAPPQHSLKAAANGLAYFSSRGTMLDSGELSNPKLLVYRLNPRSESN